MITDFTRDEIFKLIFNMSKKAKIISEFGEEEVVIKNKKYMADDTIQIVVNMPVTSTNIKKVMILDDDNNVILEKDRSVIKDTVTGIVSSFVIKFTEKELAGGSIFNSAEVK